MSKVLVSEEDLPLLEAHNWFFDKSNGYYKRRVSKNKKQYLHRAILGNPDGVVDHINGNKLDNRRENLRVTDKQGNSINRGLQRNNTSGYRGVYKARNKWRSLICINGKTINLGHFNTKEEAALAYNEAAKKYFGTYAHINEVTQ